MKFPQIPLEMMIERLGPHEGSVPIVLDTDAYAEIDDQYAIVYALISKRIDVQAIYAAPFFHNVPPYVNTRSHSPADGMNKSYAEIQRILQLLDRSSKDFVFRGSDSFLKNTTKPIQSEATNDLICRAKSIGGGLLYVVAIGAITNIASAILLDPDIIKNIIIIWVAAQPLYWHTASDFNLTQDFRAAQVVFNSGVPVILIPCKGVAELLLTTLPEVQQYVRGRGKIGDYLYSIFEGFYKDHYARSKPIWDICTIGYLNNPDWIHSEIHHSPVLNDDLSWGEEDRSRHLFRIAVDLSRDSIFGDFFRKLQIDFHT